MDRNIRINILLALTSGLLLGIPWCIPSLFFVIFVAWVPLLYLEARTRFSPNPYAMFNYSLVSFLLWNILGTWWITQAQPVGAMAIMMANALVQALVFWSISRVRTILNLPLLLPFLCIWMGYEYFHQAWDLAWPWLNLGNALATAPKIIQWYEFTGVRGGTLWIILTNLAVWKVLDTRWRKGLAASIPVISATVLLLILPALVSYHIFQAFKEEGETVTIALVQPNLDPYTEKFVTEKQARHLEDFLLAAEGICDDNTQFLFGPETLIVHQIDENDPAASHAFRRLLDFRKKYPKLNILLGVHSFQKVGDKDIPPGSRFNQEKRFYYEAFNTALFLLPGAPPQFYHKTKLVPLFERMPFVQYLGFLGKYSLELGGYSGTYSLRQASTHFVMPEASIGILPTVCFESVFGLYCAQNLPREKGFIAMITNDGWWKNTPGYLHHYHFSPVRAIECRRDLVRAANTGISALIDARGMVIARTPWWEKATLKGRIRLRQGRTFYARHGDYLGRLSLFSGVLLLLAGGVRRRMGRKRP